MTSTTSDTLPVSILRFTFYKLKLTLNNCSDREVTPIVVWFFINILYFPYDAQDLAKVPFEEFSRPIFEKLARVQDLETPN